MTKSIVEIAMLVIAVVCGAGGIWNRFKLDKGIGLRFIQYLGLTVLMPIFVILALEGRISQEMTGAIAAAAVGGVLTGFGRDENSR
jgi:drug/metabolite transporter (DMT)-like permease